MNLKSGIQVAMLFTAVMSLAACASLHHSQQNASANVYPPMVASTSATTSAANYSGASHEINMDDQSAVNNNATTVSATGKPVKTTASLKQIQQAAKNGNPDAEYALGYMYYYGQKVPQNNEAARAWIQKAAAQGQPQAMTALKMIETAQKQQHPAMAAVDTHRNAHHVPILMKTADMNQTPAAVANTQQVPAKQKTTNSVAQINPSAHANLKDVATGIIQQGETNLERQPSNHYTLQLLGTYSKIQVVDIITKNGLTGESNVNAYRTTFNGRDWYVLTYGLFNTIKQAKQGIAHLPASIQRLKPWIDSIGNIKQRIRQAKVKA